MGSEMCIRDRLTGGRVRLAGCDRGVAAFYQWSWRQGGMAADGIYVESVAAHLGWSRRYESLDRMTVYGISRSCLVAALGFFVPYRLFLKNAVVSMSFVSFQYTNALHLARDSIPLRSVAWHHVSNVQISAHVLRVGYVIWAAHRP